MNRPLIAVLGATGAQGGGVVRALLADPQRRYRVRALTRRPTSSAAVLLAAAGAEVVAADLDDRPSLTQAFADAHGVFAVTNFWEHGSPERETQQARHIAEAAAAARVGHVVWSTLEDTRRDILASDRRFPTLQGRYKVPHLDAKGEADAFFTTLGVPTTFLHTSFFWENLIHFGMGPQRGADGVLRLALPLHDRPLPGIAVSDIGHCTAALFALGSWTIGRRIGIAGAHRTGAQMAEALARRLGEPVQCVPVPFADFAALPVPGAADLASMFRYKHEFNAGYCALRSVAASRHLHPGLLDFDAWLDRHAHRMPVAPAHQAAPAFA